MLDIKQISEKTQEIKESLSKRNGAYPIDEALALDKQRKAIIAEVEQLKAQRNAASQEVSRLKREKQDADSIIKQTQVLGDRIKVLDDQQREIEDALQKILYEIPNTPHLTVPSGKSSDDNVVVRICGEPRKFSFTAKPHWELGEAAGWFDWPRAAKITGARFTVYRGLAARLERAVTNFMLDTHVYKNGYTEMFTPFMVNRASMIGTGQLPKFEEDAFSVKNTDYFLVPTAEVPVTNLHRDEILEASELPIKYCAYTACFRAEAGSAGRDTRGVIRQHQFNKVELVRFAHPDNSYESLEQLTADAEKILQMLELPYRVALLCSGDIGFSSAKTYDLEVWMPSYERYVEISSCSNFESFQARRANIRFRQEKGAKPQFVHTLNGSGLAVGRTVAAIIENYQNEDGSVTIPKVLEPYMQTAIMC